MKRALSLLTIILFFQSTIFPQGLNTAPKEILTQEVVPEKSYPVPGSHLLREKEQRLIEYFEQYPEINRLAKTRSVEWGFTVGSTHEWWADYFEEQDSGEEQYLVPSTCQAVGTNCYVFVEDALWATDRVDQAAVDAIVEAFDNSTPADAPNNDGIYNVDTRTFGDPPDVDSDPKIIILILDILDGWSQGTGGGYVAGYFYSLNEHPDSGTDGSRSNEAEIFYMDCNPAVLTTDSGRQGVLATTAHEFQHMIHWQHDVGEMTFVNEGLSEIAEHVCGYGVRPNGGYTQNTNVNLLSWDQTGDVLDDYSRAAFWTLYIYEQFGVDILKDFVDNHHSIWDDFSATFNGIDPSIDPNTGFFEVFEEWLIANYVNGNSADSKYIYQYSPLSKPTPVATYVGNPNGTGAGTLVPFGAEYIKFSGGSDLNIIFTGDVATRVKALKIGSLEVVDINKNTNYTFNDFGDTVNEITFLVYNTSPALEGDYSYIVTGTAVAGSMELAYEDGVDDGAFGLATGDSIAVWFNGIVGAKLDSLRVIYSGSGRIMMDISKLDGDSFLRGATMYGPVNKNIPASEDWQTINLVTQDLDASDDFVVSFLMGSDPENPTISVRGMPDTGVYHSRTYTEAGTPARTDWWIFTNTDTPPLYWNYLIRAYVSVGDVTVAIDQSGIVTIPNDFHLDNNYPNPFNPSTTFRFSTPEDGLVKFTVHDLLGRVIYSENRDLFAGNYSFTWEGTNQLDQQVVSGVYFLRMEAEGFSQTRKMLMMK